MPVEASSRRPEEVLDLDEIERLGDGETYYFCGKGCKLGFDEDPEKVFAPGYTPSM